MLLFDMQNRLNHTTLKWAVDCGFAYASIKLKFI